jgi:hypothetical protein
MQKVNSEFFFRRVRMYCKHHVINTSRSITSESGEISRKTELSAIYENAKRKARNKDFHENDTINTTLYNIF